MFLELPKLCFKELARSSSVLEKRVMPFIFEKHECFAPPRDLSHTLVNAFLGRCSKLLDQRLRAGGFFLTNFPEMSRAGLSPGQKDGSASSPYIHL